MIYARQADSAQAAQLLAQPAGRHSKSGGNARVCVSVLLDDNHLVQALHRVHTDSSHALAAELHA